MMSFNNASSSSFERYSHFPLSRANSKLPMLTLLRFNTLRGVPNFGSFMAPNKRRMCLFFPSSICTRSFVFAPPFPIFSTVSALSRPIGVSIPCRAEAICSSVTWPLTHISYILTQPPGWVRAFPICPSRVNNSRPLDSRSSRPMGIQPSSKA